MAFISRVISLLAIIFVYSAPTLAAPVEFVVLGDMPYGNNPAQELAYISKKIRQSGTPFVIFYGDMKSGRRSCDDATLAAHKAAVYGLKKGAVFFTPGDNDWIDCDRLSTGGFDELERLSALRKLLYSGDEPRNEKWRIMRQVPAYPENALWEYGGLQFATLHIVGTDNGRRNIEKSDTAKALAAVAARDEANLAWLNRAFDTAEERLLAAVVITIHADTARDFKHRKMRRVACTTQQATRCNPFLGFLKQLTERADRFDKPVLLIHGSTSNYCLDRGFGGWRAPKLWRLNGPGDFVVIDAAVIRVDVSDVLPFRVRGLVNGDQTALCVTGNRTRR